MSVSSDMLLKTLPNGSISETMARLSSKAGVSAVLVMDSGIGSVLHTMGSFSSSRATSAAMTSSEPGAAASAETNRTGGNDGIEELAAVVWNFVKTAGGLVEGLDSEDEVKLLRLRTKKHEFVIVPDSKYIFVVVHETPAA